MRIYIESIIPQKINKQNLIDLEKKMLSKVKTNDILEIFSGTGMYVVENEKTWKIIPRNEKIRKIMEDDTCFLLDETILERKQCSQIPIDHVTIKTTIFHYDTRNIRLVVEGCYDANTKCENEDKYRNFKVKNIYFEPKSEKMDIINNSYAKNEINVFLSLLNNI